MVVCFNQKIIYKDKYLEKSSLNNINKTKNLNTLNGNLIKITSDEVFNNEFDKFIYFGRDTCPICQIYKPNLVTVLYKKNMQIYYFDTDYWRGKKEFNKILNRYKVNEIPSLIFIKKDGTFYKQEFNESLKDLKNEKLLKEEIIKFIEKYN